MHCVPGFPLRRQFNNAVKKRNAVNLEQCWPLGSVSSFSNCLQTLYLIIIPEICQGSLFSLMFATFRNQASLLEGKSTAELPSSTSGPDVPPTLRMTSSGMVVQPLSLLCAQVQNVAESGAGGNSLCWTSPSPTLRTHHGVLSPPPRRS